MSARIYRFPAQRPERPADVCRGCGEKQPEPLSVSWPWCSTCSLAWRTEHAGARGLVPPPRRRSR